MTAYGKFIRSTENTKGTTDIKPMKCQDLLESHKTSRNHASSPGCEPSAVFNSQLPLAW